MLLRGRRRKGAHREVQDDQCRRLSFLRVGAGGNVLNRERM